MAMNNIESACKASRNGGLPHCNYGGFVTQLHRAVGSADGWKFREYANGVLVAMLGGKAGRVEVWGGNHRTEVWFVERVTKKEVLVAHGFGALDDAELAEAVWRACSMACVQMTIKGVTDERRPSD